MGNPMRTTLKAVLMLLPAMVAPDNQPTLLPSGQQSWRAIEVMCFWLHFVCSFHIVLDCLDCLDWGQ
jgi:hypothetical protein